MFIFFKFPDGLETIERPRQELATRLQVVGLARVSHQDRKRKGDESSN